MTPLIGLVVAVWFLAPWLVFAVCVIRLAWYERHLHLFAGVSSFRFLEMRRRIGDLRARDARYDRLRRNGSRWLVVTACWWIVSFLVLVAALTIVHRCGPFDSSACHG